MKRKLLHLYDDMMNLYGEYANVAILARYLRDLGHEVSVDTLNMYEEKDISDFDFYYMGAGTERKQKAMLPELMKYQTSLKTAADAGKILLFTGNACDLLGAGLTDAEGKRYKTLGFGSFETVEIGRRITGDCICTMDGLPDHIVGFINKCSNSKNVEEPLLHLIMGYGNEKDRGADGFRMKNCFGTHVTGPLLVKNPAMLQYFAGLLLGQTPEKPQFAYMNEAYQITCQELLRRLEA